MSSGRGTVADPAGGPGPGAVSALLVMGVSGSGKSRIGALLAARLGWAFKDADDLHPPGNVEKMRAGVPLDEDDRGPWLLEVSAWIESAQGEGRPVVVACSALRRAHRAVLVAGPHVRLVYLRGSEALIAARIAARTGHFMPGSLLRTQFEALEEPGPGEDAVTASVEPAPEQVVADVVEKLGLSPDP